MHLREIHFLPHDVQIHYVSTILTATGGHLLITLQRCPSISKIMDILQNLLEKSFIPVLVQILLMIFLKVGVSLLTIHQRKSS